MESEHEVQPSQKEVQPIVPSLQLLELQSQEEGQGKKVTIKDERSSLKEVEEIIGHKFNDPSLLEMAFTDSSYQERKCLTYERLEYVGDSVLSLLIAKEHFFLYPDLAPGKLTRLRAANVDTEKLARVALKFGLHKFLRHKKPLLDKQIGEFMEAIPEYPLHSSGLIDAPKVLADIVESIIGAIYIDSNFSMDTTWMVVKNLLQPIITPATLQTHPMTKLYEICQKNALKLRFVDLWQQSGEIEFFIENEFVGRGKYKMKKLIALNRAAENAYNEIVRRLACNGIVRTEDGDNHQNQNSTDN